MAKLIKGVNDLQTLYPEIAKEWNYDKNGILHPSDFTCKNGHKVWWKCSLCDFEWEAKISNRTVRQSNCPKCGRKIAGNNSFTTKIMKNGSLADNHPDLISEWNYEKNGSLHPSMVMSRSSRKVWWRCKKGHEWKASISGRTDEGERATGCPECNRTGTSFPEQAILYYVKQHFDDVKNNDKHIGVELDIYIPSKNAAIEYDGQAWHKSRIESDIQKNELCKKNGIELIRVREPKLIKIDGCICIFRTDDRSNDSLNEVIIEVLKTLNVKDIDVDIERDSIQILAQYKTREYFDSLEAQFPDVAEEWNYEKNGSLLPSNVKARSNRKVWWKCIKGHEWEALISWRTDRRNQRKDICPICNNEKVLSGYNDLKTWCINNDRLDLIEQWNSKKNGDNMQEHSAKSSKKVWWILPYDDENTGKHFDFEWEATIYNRTMKQSKCPFLYHSVWPGFNDLETVCPDIAKEWNYERNLDCKPSECVKGSNKVVWWKCEQGHEWKAQINNRVRRNSKCPYCAKVNN